MKLDVYYNDIDAYCCRVLAKNIERGNLPDGEIDNADIRTVDLVRLRQYRHIHLYAGIGGFPYGFSLAGVPTSISILTAGFPCQPFSLAGKQKGTSDDRYLWPITLDAIRALRPQYAVLENVASLLTAERGTVFGRILSDLAESGYDAEWQVIPASAVGAPHARERLFIIAHTGGARLPRPVFTQGIRITARKTPAEFGNRNITCGSWWSENIADLHMGDGVSIKLARHRVKSNGNAIVPQIAAYIGECIKAHAFS